MGRRLSQVNCSDVERIIRLPSLQLQFYNRFFFVLWGFGEKKQKKKDWQQLLAQVPILNKKKEEERKHSICITEYTFWGKKG